MVLDPLDLESTATWVLGTKLQSFGRVARALSGQALSQVPSASQSVLSSFYILIIIVAK